MASFHNGNHLYFHSGYFDSSSGARAHPNFPRRAAPARFCYYEQETNGAYLGSAIFSL